MLTGYTLYVPLESQHCLSVFFQWITSSAIFHFSDECVISMESLFVNSMPLFTGWKWQWCSGGKQLSFCFFFSLKQLLTFLKFIFVHFYFLSLEWKCLAIYGQWRKISSSKSYCNVSILTVNEMLECFIFLNGMFLFHFHIQPVEQHDLFGDMSTPPDIQAPNVSITPWW